MCPKITRLLYEIQLQRAVPCIFGVFSFQIVIDKVTGNQWSGSIAVGITTKTVPLLAVPASALEIRDGTWLMTGSCVMKDAVIIKENYGHSLDRLQVQFSLFSFLSLEQKRFSDCCHTKRGCSKLD